MSPGRGGQGIEQFFGPGKRQQSTHVTTLPPKNYIHINKYEEAHTPNLINIYRHDYKSKHFQFGTSLPTQQYQEELTKATKHCTDIVRDLNMTEEDMSWVGDELSYQDNWPIKSRTVRIAQLNVNGFSFAKDNFKIDIYLQGLMAFQVDIAAIQEINLNMNTSKVRDQLHKAMKRFDQRAALQTAYIHHKENSNVYQPGGNAIWNNGLYTGRITRKGQEKYGRWAYTVMVGKRGLEVMVISAYNTCKNTAEDGGTIAGQLVRALHKDGHKKRFNIRKAFFNDLQEFLLKQQEQGTEIVLAMDANTAATAEELKTLKLNTNLIDVFTTKHPTKTQPKTYFRGQQCLDYIYTTPFIAQGIEKVGYAPFYMMGKYDHRLLYVDICWDHLFNHNVDETQARGKQLSVKNRRITKLYTKRLLELERKAGIYKGVERIHRRMQTDNQPKEERTYCIQKLKTYKTIMTQLMISAYKTATKCKPQIFRWSNTLRKNGRQMRYWNDRKRCSERGDIEGLGCTVPKGYTPPEATTHDEVLHEYHLMQTEWIKTKDTSDILHHKFMVDLIEHIEETRNCSKETAKKLLYHQEASKAGHERQSKYLKKRRKGLITELLVPAPHTSDPQAFTQISDEKTIEAVLLRRNRTKLSEAKISPFCTGPLADMINENGKCAVSTSIVEGRFDIDTIDNMQIEHKKEIKMLLSELQRKRDNSGNLVDDVDTTITMKDFQTMFRKKNELTSCGPRGIIMPHWKIIAESDHLSTIQARLMEAPFKYGFTYTEWEISVHCMLMKDELPFIHRLRIIQLFEGDMNGALQLLFGRRQMQYMDTHGLNSDATYGGRKGKGCHQALNRIQYTTLYSRTMRQPMGLVDVDATGCFDRMVGRLLSLINQCNGMSQQAASCQAEVLHNMKHYVKTTRGISDNYITRNETSLLEGNGQGNAASVPGWHGHNELMCKVYKQLIHGSTITSPTKNIDFEQWLSSFIDDNKMLLSFDATTTFNDIMDKCQESLQLWETLLNITGGAVELKKCFFTVLQYYENYDWYNKRPGLPELVQHRSDQRQCIITRDGNTGIKIRQQKVTEGVRLLGVKAAANGTYKEEYTSKLEKSRELAGKLHAAPLNESLTWQAYYCRWKPAIIYCLPLTTFSVKECKKIQSPFFTALLPKLGINRHMPRAILHGPPQVAGLGLVNLEAEQISLHITGLIAQIRKNDRVGQTMSASIDALQLYLGLENHFFTLQAHTVEHRPERRENQLVYIWEELTSLGCQIVSRNFWVPQRHGANDGAIIEAIIQTRNQRHGTSNHLPRNAIWYANACRLYLRVTMLHEISSTCGRYIHNWAMDGSCTNPNNTLLYPHQAKPPQQVWKVWRECILATFLRSRSNNRHTLHYPIQRQEREEHRPWRERMRRGMRLDEAILLLPGYLKEAIGTVHFPLDNGHRLSQDYKASRTTSWTDGTVKDSIGAHSYTIRSYDDNDDFSIQGAGGTPGDYITMTSLRAEHFGVLVVVVLLDILTLIHGHDTSNKHTHYTDSKAIISRVNNDEYMTDKKYDSLDYDVWQETLRCIERAKYLNLNLQHVKGHQRETLHDVRGEQGPLTRQATYNDWCDREAEKERENHQLPAQICALEAAETYLKIPRTLVTGSAFGVVYGMKTIPEAEEYVCSKLGITRRTYNSINWKSLGLYFQTLAISQKVKVMKYIYDWQNVGSQKQLHKWADVDEYKCPYDCGAVEIPQHYLQCKKSCNNTSRLCLEAINKWMIIARTNNKIRVRIMAFLYERLPLVRGGLQINYSTPMLYEKAVVEQEQLGWKLTIKGMISKTWSEIQENEYIKIRKRENLEVWYTGTWWSKHLTKHIIFWALNEWQRRNEHLHKEMEQRTKEKTRRQCHEDILELYQKQEDTPITRIKRYFRIPLIDRLQHNPSRQRQWIDTIRSLQDKTAIQNSKNKV